MERTIQVVQPMKLAERKLLRVAAYARVSCDKDAMRHSLQAQVDYYKKMITHNPDWSFAGVYPDAYYTGTRDDRPQFVQLIGDITISMRSADYLKMPECVMNTVPVTLDSTEYEIYEEMESKMVTELDGVEIDAVNAAALTGKLCQLANGAIYTPDGETVFFHERKLDALEDLIEGANGKPVLVAYWYKHDLARIQERFKVRELKSSKDITDWNAGKIPVAVIHPASAGHGLNLQAGGSTLIWFGLTWSLELYQQTNARLWRQGQQAETVVIHHIITRGTVDEDVMQSLSEKDRSQAALMRAVRARVEARK